MQKYVILLLFFGLISCGDSAVEQEQAVAKKTPEIPPPDEDDLLLRLSADLLADPQTRAEKDQNLIVNYAIENSLDARATPSGLYYQILQPGDGDKLQWGDRISVHYRGYFLDGTEFDSSRRRGEPVRGRLRVAV